MYIKQLGKVKISVNIVRKSNYSLSIQNAYKILKLKNAVDSGRDNELTRQWTFECNLAFCVHRRS